MDGLAKLITAIASLLGAVAWPVSIFALGLIFRKEIRSTVGRIPSLIDRMRKMKIAGIEAELDRVAAEGGDQKGDVTPLQIEAAAKIAAEVDNYEGELVSQLDKLCLEYDALRRLMPAGPARTEAMTRLMIKMRALGPALIGHIDAYKGSGAPGSRLAAIAMMQMNPNACDIPWLAGRFETEQPFVFYHAALAMQNLANGALSQDEWDQLLGASQRGLDKLEAFSGLPDQPTIDVLRSLIASIRR